MKKTIFYVSIILMILIVFGCQMNTGPAGPATPTPTPTPTPGEFEIELIYSGPSVSPSVVYAAWIEDLSGKNIQNLYVCSKLAADVSSSSGPLKGDAVPNWATKKYPQNKDIDGVTGASTQMSKTVTRGLPKTMTDTTQKFRIFFEIDRSKNGNTYFIDRPAFIYATDEINLDALSATPYTLNLIGWMANNTDGSPHGQQPIVPPGVPGFKQYELNETLKYIEDTAGKLDDMVSSIQVNVRKK